MVFIILAVVVLIICTGVFSEFKRRRKLASLRAVELGVEYPNNHHILGVGYYHAASQKWFPQPWNEYREERGYYWDGYWNPTPDQRMIPKSLPSPAEVERVNQEWRKADPGRSRQFWITVEREGFGTAIRRAEGS